MERKKASDFPQELLNLLDGYVHGGISRREFLEGAEKFAVGGVTAAALFQMLKPNYAWAVQVPADDKRIKAEYDSVPSPQGNGSIKGYLVRPANATRLPSIIVIHENRGLNPYIEDVARRLAVADFIAFAPDGLTSVGGYPGDDEKAASALRPGRQRQDDAGFPGRGNLAEIASRHHGQARSSRLLLRRRRRQSAGGSDGRGSCSGGPILRSSTQRRRHGQDQGADQCAIRRARHADNRWLARLRCRARRRRRCRTKVISTKPPITASITTRPPVMTRPRLKRRGNMRWIGSTSI